MCEIKHRAGLLSSVIPLPPPVTRGWCRSQALRTPGQDTQVLLPGPPSSHCPARPVLLHPSIPSSGSPSYTKASRGHVPSAPQDLPVPTYPVGLDSGLGPQLTWQLGLSSITILSTPQRFYQSASLSAHGTLKGKNHVFPLCGSSVRHKARLGSLTCLLNVSREPAMYLALENQSEGKGPGPCSHRAHSLAAQVSSTRGKG